MARLFKREARVTIARPFRGDVSSSAARRFFAQAPNAVVVEGLRVQFRVEKNLASEPNTCDVTITNLAERTRGEVQDRPLYVRVDAGYDGELQRLFTGDLRWSNSVRNGADWETTLQLGDGARAFAFGRVNRSFRGGVTARTAVVEAADALGLTVKLSARAEAELQSQFAGGLSLIGLARDTLDQVLTPFGMSWSIQDGRLQILLADEARPEAPVLISQDTGMIGSPEFGAPETKGKKPILKFKTLLHPELTPGTLVSVQSATINGRFRCERVAHMGDSRGREWYTEVEAKAR